LELPPFFLFCAIESQKTIKKGGNSNLIACNAITQNKKKEATPISLQSIKLELPPFKNNNL
jgi:hypothetical protein